MTDDYEAIGPHATAGVAFLQEFEKRVHASGFFETDLGPVILRGEEASDGIRAIAYIKGATLRRGRPMTRYLVLQTVLEFVELAETEPA